MTEPDRFLTLDVLRGVAVMGIFSVNVIAFAMPEQAYFNPAAYGGSHGASLLVWAANFVLVDGKMRGLFSMLFGASTLLVIERAQAAGLSPASIHYRRMAWLLAFGLVHYYLLWFGDILTLYAVMGMVLYAFRKSSVRRLLFWAAGFLLLDLALMGVLAWAFTGLEAAAHAPHASAATLESWRTFSHEFAPPAADALARDLALYRGGWAGIVAHRLAEEAGAPLMQIVIGGPETLGYMLLGMAGLRSGVLLVVYDRAVYRGLVVLGLGVGIAAYAFLAWNGWRTGFATGTVFVDFFLLATPFRLAMMIAFAAAIMLLCERESALRSRVAAAGRAAFTNYLGTTILASLIFNGYGFGLYGHLSRWQAWLVAPCFWALMLLWSKPWLERYRYGPFEWLWRSLARWSPQPMRRRRTPVEQPA